MYMVLKLAVVLYPVKFGYNKHARGWLGYVYLELTSTILL